MPGDDAMVDRTPIIVFGEVRSVMAAPGAPRPSTDVLFEVEQVLKGFVSGGTIVVRQPGGVSEDGRFRVRPKWATRDERTGAGDAR